MKKEELSQAIKSSIPVFIGYAPGRKLFGILAKTSGITLLECVMFSAVVFAGASQFIAQNLLTAGMGFGGVILKSGDILCSGKLSVSQDELVNRIHIDLGTTARALQQLENEGCIRRETDEKDKQIKRVFLTQKAKGIKDEFFSILFYWDKAIVSGFTAEKIEVLTDKLSIMTENTRKLTN